MHKTSTQRARFKGWTHRPAHISSHIKVPGVPLCTAQPASWSSWRGCAGGEGSRTDSCAAPSASAESRTGARCEPRTAPWASPHPGRRLRWREDPQWTQTLEAAPSERPSPGSPGPAPAERNGDGSVTEGINCYQTLQRARFCFSCCGKATSIQISWQLQGWEELASQNITGYLYLGPLENKCFPNS